MILNLYDKKIEKKVLSLLLRPPTHMRAMSLTPDFFAVKEHKEFFSLLKKYVVKYRSAPSLSTLELFSNDILTETNSENIASALEMAKNLPKVRKGEATFYFDKLSDYRIGRGLYDIGTGLTDKLNDSSLQFNDIKKDLLGSLLSLGGDTGHVKRGFFTDRDEVNHRYEQYRDITKGVAQSGIIPYGIKALDESLGGMRKTFVTMFYSRTGGGKTRMMMNLAYNAAMAGYNVMYFTLEMSFDLISSCFDARLAEVDSNKIIFGGLNKEDRVKYQKALKRQMRDGLGIWLVDIPSHTTMDKILEEIEVYHGVNGVYPDLIAIDYSHLVTPTVNAPDRSTRYDNLYKEFHEAAKYYDTALVTAAPESGQKSRNDAQKGANKVEMEEGPHDIGASNFMAYHCETVIRLAQTKADRLRYRMSAIPVKSRYGKIGDPIELYVDWATSYIGDPLGGKKIRKYPKKAR